MAAEAADRPWSLTQILGAYEVPASAAARAQTRETSRRCRCCPYGYHIDVDFLDYLQAVKAGSGLSKLRKIHGHRLRQRQAMETQLLMIQPTASGQRPGSCEAGESSDSSSSPLMTPHSQSEDEGWRDSVTMADLDASIADALDSIEALMEPRRPRAVETAGSSDKTATTPGSGAGAGAARSISAGDVRWTPIDARTSTSVVMTSHDPASPLSSVSCSSLHDDSVKHGGASSTPEVFLPASAQSFDVDFTVRGPDDSSGRSSELRSQSESRVVSTSAHHQESSSKLRPPGSDVATATDKSHVARPQPPAVRPRRATNVGASREDEPSEDYVRYGAASSSDAAADAGRRLSAAADGTDDILERRARVADERQTAPRSTVSDSSVTAQTASVGGSTTTGDVSRTSGRLLPAPQRQTDPTDARTSKESSFSSVRALLSRKSGGSQRTSAARVDRPVRRSRQQAGDAVPTKMTSDDVISAPAASLPADTAPARDRSTERELQSSESECVGTTATSALYDAEQSEESVTALSPPSELAEAESDLPSSSSRDQIDHDSLEASFEELARAMTILERSRDGDDNATFDRRESSSIQPDVLMTVRKYIASSLQQMRMLEQQVRLIPVLQLRVSVLKEDKRLLKLQLQKSKNGSGGATRNACVGVSELSVPAKQRDLPAQQDRSDLAGQLQSSAECQGVGVGDAGVEMNADSRLYCQSCKSALRQRSLENMTEPINGVEEETSHALRTSGAESESVGYPSVSSLVSKLQGEVRHDGPPPVTRRSRSVEETVHDGSVTSLRADTSSSLTAATRRPKPPVPRKQISIRREEGTNQTTVGVQCTLLQDSKEDSQVSEGGEIIDTVSKRAAVKRTDFRAHEPDLVTTHCLGGLSLNEHELSPTAVAPARTFADKETETDRTLQRSAAVNTPSSTVDETLPSFSSYDTRSRTQTIHCSVNTDISGDILSAESLHAQSSVWLEPGVREQLRTAVNESMDADAESEDTRTDLSLAYEVARSFSGASCAAERKPTRSDVACWTDNSLLSSLVRDVSELQGVEPSSKDVECSVDMTTQPPVTTTACNTETSWDRLIRASDANDAFCQTDAESKRLTCEVACGNDRPVDSVGHPQLIDGRRRPPGELVDVACGDDAAVITSDVGCNTEASAKTDVGCSATEENPTTNDASCWADIKLSVCDKSSFTDTEFVGEAVRTYEGLTRGKTVTVSDVASLTDSLTTSEMSSGTELYEAGARGSTVEAGCLTDIVWKPPTDDKGCSTDVGTASLSSVVCVPCAEDAPALKPPTTSVALNTDAWLLTSDVTFLDTVKQIVRPSVTEAASMTDVVETRQTSDAFTSPMNQHTSECWTSTDAEVKPSLVDVESWARPSVREVGCSTEGAGRKRPVRDAESSADIVLRPPTNDTAVNTEKRSHSVASNTDTTVHPAATETASSVTLLTTSASGATDVSPRLNDASSATDSPVCRDTREAACNTDENMPVPWLFGDVSHSSDETDALRDFCSISTVYWTNDEGAKVCRLCGVQNIRQSSVENDASVPGVSSQLLSVDDSAETADVIVEWRQVDAGIRRGTKDAGCDAGRILTTDAAMNTDFGVDPSEEKQATLGTDVACNTSDVTLTGTTEAARRSDDAETVAAAAVPGHASPASKCPTCLAKPATRDSSCGTDSSPSSSSSLADDLRRSDAGRAESSRIQSTAVRDVGVNTDGSRTIQTTAEAAWSAETRTWSTCDVGLNTAEAVTDDGAHKPSRIPHRPAPRRPDALVAKPVTKDASSITDIVIAPSDEREVLGKTDRKVAAGSLPSTAEVACNTETMDDVETSGSVGAKVARPAVRTVGCGADLTAEVTRPSTRDAGCTASPDTKSRSCSTDAVPPVKETPVKAGAVERTRTGLQVARKVKSRSVATTQSSDTLATPTDVPAVAASAKSPTFDVACGTDLEFNSKYFNLDDDSGLLRQLSAEDLVEVIRRRRDPSSSSTSSPTCDVACNTEYDSRPCTPARVNYSSYYVGAAVDPAPATAADVACGPDEPSPALCDVACGTEDRPTNMSGPSDTDTSFQTTSCDRVNVDVPPSTSENVDHGRPTHTLPATNTSDEDAATETEQSKCDESRTASTAVGDFDVREELVPRSRGGRDSLVRSEGRASASRRGLRLDFGGVASGAASAADEQTRHEDFNNNDDDDDERRQAAEFQTYSLDLRPDDDPESPPTRSVLVARHDVKFIDDDDDSELDVVVDRKGSDDGRTTKDITTGDEDVGSPASMTVDLGRRWGTVDLVPKSSAVSPLLAPSDSAPLKSIMKSPRSSSEITLSKTKRGISFSHDTVFK